MALLVVEALVGLVIFDLASLFGFEKAYALVRNWPVRRRRSSRVNDTAVCSAVDEACVWYFKRARCLQRSAVTTWLLRLHGVAACLVIGFRPVPMESHAWVEVDGQVVNDRPQYQRFFQVLDRL